MVQPTVLITGATGATGGATIAALLDSGQTVNAVEPITGRPPMTIAEFVAQHQAAFV